MSDGRKTQREYWDSVWTDSQELPLAFEPDPTNLAGHVGRCTDEWLRAALEPIRGGGGAFLEVGCARSIWLPYVAKRHGLRAFGLDYSEIGCAQAREICRRAGVSAEIVHADLFSPPRELLGRFDAVVSFGVVEHFTDLAGCMRQIADFLRPGGYALTWIPNMHGLIGRLQRLVNREIYEKHVPLSRDALAAGIRKAGLEVLDCRYFMSLNLGVVNFGRTSRAIHLTQRVFSALSKLVWAFDRVGLGLPPNRVTSPYITCIARKNSMRNVPRGQWRPPVHRQPNP